VFVRVALEQVHRCDVGPMAGAPVGGDVFRRMADAVDLHGVFSPSRGVGRWAAACIGARGSQSGCGERLDEGQGAIG
jgi:hypothetical protein